MKTRSSMAGLALATMLLAGWSTVWAADAARTPQPQKVTLSVPNTQ